MPEQQPSTSFPSQFAPSTVKNSEKYCKQQSQAFHSEAAHAPTEAALCRNNKNYTRYRQYSRGEQPVEQYKESMTFHKLKEGKKPNASFRNINFEILKFFPKMKNAVINKVVNADYRLTANAIDPKSFSAKQSYRASLLEFMVNKEEIERFEMLTKLGLERPLGEGEVPPSNIVDIDAYIDMNPKDMTSMEVLDFLRQSLAASDWKQQAREIADDLFDLSVGGTVQYIDSNNKIKCRRIIPENAVTNHCIYPDFRDMIRFGEYVWMTVSDLKRETKGAWEEKVYQDLANKVSQQSTGAPKYNNFTSGYYFNQNTYAYAYDHEKVCVFKNMWYSVDSEVHVEYQNESGNRRVKQMDHNYVPFKGDKTVNNGKGMSDDEYNKFNEGKKKIMRTEVRNVYRCSWVVDTDLVYDHGLLPNMLRSSTNWQETVMPVVLVTTNFISTTSIVEQPIDQVQLNYLQFQSHVSASKPPGIAIEKTALARIGKGAGGAGGKKWDPKEDLQMYAESGNFLYDGYDVHGNALQQLPFKELANGLSPGAEQHFGLMVQFIDLIRDMLGLNSMSDASETPDRMGKTVAQLSLGASDNALSHIKDAFKSVYERTAKNMFYLFQTNVARMNPDDVTESLGLESYKHFTLNNDLGLLDMGIILEEGPDSQIKENITEILKLMVTNQEIPGEDAVMIQMVDNPYRQVQMIRKHRLELMNRKAREQQQAMQTQGDENTKTAMATEQAKQQTMMMENNNLMKQKQLDAIIAEQAAQKAFERQFMIETLKLNSNKDDVEKGMIHEYLQNILNAQKELYKQKMANEKPQPAMA